MQQIQNSIVYDEGLYLHQTLNFILPTFYLLSVETCQSVWTGEVFKLPGFGNQEFKPTTAELNKVKGDRTETTETFVYSALFMEGKRRGIGSALPVEWTIPLGGTIVGSVTINARLAIGNVYASKRMDLDEFPFTWKDPFGNEHSRTDIVKVFEDPSVIGNEHSRIDIVKDFELDFVVYLTKNTTKCKWSKLITIL